jgi:two-component SAPR family response regulator
LGQLVVAHTTLHVITTPIAIAIFLGLAIYVITCNPRRPIGWVFSLLCLMVASIYMSHLFLTSQPPAAFSLVHLLTRWEWAAIVFSSTLYLHVASFYFPSSWQRFRLPGLALLYLVSVVLILLSLFTDLLVDGHLYHAVPHFIEPKQGLFFIVVHAGLFTLAMGSSAAGLLISYYSTRSPSFRQQVVYLLVTTALALLGGIIHWVTLLTETSHQTAHLLSEILLILAAILYGHVVVRYGSFAGRPLARRSLFYSALGVIAGLAALYLAVSLDQWLMSRTPLPYYLVTGILVLVVATGFPTVSPWLTQGLDKWFFQTQHQEQLLAQYLAEALAGTPDAAQLQVKLLETLRNVLNIQNGYVALAAPDLPKDKLLVQLVRGYLFLQPGDLIRRPPLHSEEPQLVAALLPQPLFEPGWQDIALFCPLTGEGLEGVLALGEKRDKTGFHLPDLLFCAELIKHIGSLGRLQIQPGHSPGAAQLQQLPLRPSGEKTTSRASQRLASPESDAASLEIRVLGPLQVIRQEQLISETAWGSEKAKGLLAYLLWKSPLAVTREELSEALWPDRAFDETANVFHVTLHRLRRVLQTGVKQDKASGYILHDRGRYRFNLEAPHKLDMMAFHSLVMSDNPANLQAAVNLYRGAYMEDMYWALPIEAEAERRQLEQLYTDALRRLAAQSHDREALYYLEKILAIEPADEATHRALVLGYLARGRGSLARQQVLRWQQALSEFNLEASAETKLLWQSIEAKNTPT